MSLIKEFINTNTGLTKCVYTAYGIQIDGSKPPQDVTIDGYYSMGPTAGGSKIIIKAIKFLC